MSRSVYEDPELPDLIAAAMERIDRGLRPNVRELCRSRPDLIAPLEECIETGELLSRGPSRARAADSSIGEILDGRYRLTAGLGAGAMGVVYRAEDLELGRDVAVKILRSAVLATEEAGLRFAREAELLAAVRHDAVVTIHDRGCTARGEAYLVLELLEGVSLDTLLDRAAERARPLNDEDSAWIAEALGAPSLPESTYVRTAVRLVADLADGLQAAHDAGVYHRDVKPSNVLVRRNGRPVLLDFGIAAHASLETITRDDATIGTPAYMAPEALRRRPAPGPTLDVYGLTATLYHLLTLRPPYTGTPTQVLAKLASEDPAPATRVRSGMPRDLQAILDRGMARSVRARYPSAHALGRDLRAFLNHEPVSVRPHSAARRLLRRLRRSPAALTGIAVVCLAAAAWGGLRWRNARLRERAFVTRSHLRHLTPNLALLNFENRAPTSDEERRELTRILDAAAASCVAPVPARLRRACFRLDNGDPRGAAEDMRAVAEHYGTAYSRSLAERYAALPPDARSARALDTQGLPDPVAPIDRYLAAFHELRLLHMATGQELIEDPVLDGFPPATEIRLLFESVRIRRLPPAERASAGLALYERVVRFEEELGMRSATTAHIGAFALYLQERYEECIRLVREGIELAPYAIGLPINGGRAATHLRRYEEAREFLERAIRLRPQDPKPWPSLVEVLTDAGEFDEAQTRIDTAPLGTGADARRRRLVMQAELDCMRALSAWEEGDSSGAIKWADHSLEAFDAAASIGPVASYAHRAMSEAIATDSPRLMFRALARMMVDAPKRARLLQILLEHMPAELDEDDTSAVRAYLQALSGVLTQIQSR